MYLYKIIYIKSLLVVPFDELNNKVGSVVKSFIYSYLFILFRWKEYIAILFVKARKKNRVIALLAKCYFIELHLYCLEQYMQLLYRYGSSVHICYLHTLVRNSRMDVCVTKWKSENTTVRIVPKYNRNNRWNRQKLIPPNTHTQDRSLSWTGTDTSIRSHTVKLVLWANIFSTSLWFCITNNCWIMRTIWHVQRKQTPANGLL